MPTVDFTSAYRDATKGSTLKALAARRAEMQAALATARPREVKSPEQAIASVADTISGSIREGRLANQEAQGRERFAQLLAGGLAPDEIGEAMGLDPETTMKYQERTWAKEDSASAAAARQAELEQGHGWDVDAATARVKAEQDAAKLQADAKLAADKAARSGTIEDRDFAAQAAKDAAAAAHTLKVEDDTTAAGRDTDQTMLGAALKGDNAIAVDEAVKRGLLPPEDGEALKKQISDKAASEIEKNKPTTYTQVTPQMVQELGLGGDIAAHPDQFQRDNKTGQITPYERAAGAPALKEQYDAQDKLASIDSHLDDLHRALELNPKVIQGPVGGFAAEVMGSDPFGVLQAGAEWAGQKENIEATKEFGQLMSAGAMTRMAEELKGSTAYQEVMHYQNIFASPTATEEVRKNALLSMLNVLKKHRDVSAARIESYGAEKPGDYVYTPRTAAPADAGGADAAEPDLSTVDEEELKRIAGGR